MASNAVATFRGASLTRGASANVAAGAGALAVGTASLRWKLGMIGDKPLGEGGFGVVLAWGLPNRQIVARKTFKKQ